MSPPPRRPRSCSGSRWLQAAPLAAAIGCAACGGVTAPRFPTASKLPDDDRQPDAIAVDLPSSPPPTRDATSAEQGIVALRSPLGVTAARDTVGAFFRAVVHEDMTELSSIVRSGATVEDARAGAARSHSTQEREALSWWRERFRKHEFEALSAHLVYRPSEIETYRTDQLEALPVRVRHSPQSGPDALQPSDIILRVPIITHSVSSERLLGDELFFWLRRVEDRYVIVHMAEPAPF